MTVITNIQLTQTHTQLYFLRVSFSSCPPTFIQPPSLSLSDASFSPFRPHIIFHP